MFGFVLGKLFKRRVKGFVDESCDVESCIVDMSGSFQKKNASGKDVYRWPVFVLLVCQV